MGGGSVDVPNVPDRKFGQEKRTLNQGYNFQTNQLGDFVNSQPLLGAAQQGALSAYGGLGGLTAPISALAGQAPGFFGGLQQNVSGLQNQLGGLSGQLGGLIPGINQAQQRYTQQGQGLFNQLGGLSSQLGGLSSRLGGIYGAQGGPGSIISSGGALTGGLLRAADQQSLSAQEQAGLAHTSSGVAQRVLNADQYRASRLAQAQQVGQQLTQGQAGIAGERAGITGQQAGITGLLANLASQFTGQKADIYGRQAGIAGQQGGLDALRAGLFGQLGNLTTALPGAIQGLQTGAQNMLTGAEGANVGAFGATTSPILGYIQNLFSGNQQKNVNMAQLQTQAGAQNASSGKEGIGSILSIIGPILGAVIGSDERIKTKIRDTKFKTKEGIAVKSFEYRTKPGVSYLGVLAQDVERKDPSGVIEDPVSGIKFVDAARFPVIKIGEKRKA